MADHDRADLVRDLGRARAVLLHERDLMARFDEFLGEVVADFPPADDEYEHGQTSRVVEGVEAGNAVSASGEWLAS